MSEFWIEQHKTVQERTTVVDRSVRNQRLIPNDGHGMIGIYGSIEEVKKK